MVLILKSPLIAILIETILHCAIGETSKLGLTEPLKTTLIEMKPLFYSFDDSDRVSKAKRLLKKNRKKDSSNNKRRGSFRLLTSDADHKEETGAEAGSGSSEESGGGGKVIKLDKGLLQSHKQHELDHLNHDSHSGEDKFVKMIWDKGDGFVKRWHWDRGEKIKENHSVAAKKHLEHHDKGKVEEHIEKQQGAVVTEKKEENSEVDSIDEMAKSTVSSDKETKTDDIVKRLRLKMSEKEPQLKTETERENDGVITLGENGNGNGNGNDNNEVDNNDENSGIKTILLGRSEEPEDKDTDGDIMGSTDGDNANGNSGADVKLRQQLDYKEILQRANKHQTDEDRPRLKAGRFPSKKQRNKKENSDDENSSSADNDNGDGSNKVKKQRDYHRKVIVREEKSELASQERYRGGEDGKGGETQGEKSNGAGEDDGGENGYESGSKGRGYIKHYQLTSDGRKKTLDPLDFASIIGDQSLQVKTAIATDNVKTNTQNDEKKDKGNNQNKLSLQREIDTSQSRQHFMTNNLQMINPR